MPGVEEYVRIVEGRVEVELAIHSTLPLPVERGTSALKSASPSAGGRPSRNPR